MKMFINTLNIFYCKYFEWENDKVVEDKIIVSEELGIKIELNDFKEFIVFEETFNPLMTDFKTNFIPKSYNHLILV